MVLVVGVAVVVVMSGDVELGTVTTGPSFTDPNASNRLGSR